IVNLCLSFGVQKLCYVSSVASLSAAVGKVADEQNEWNPEARNSDYAISKHGGEMEVWRGSQEGLKVIIVNPSIILGRSDYNSGSGLLFKQVASEPPRYTTGGSGYVDAKDVARAMVALQFSEVANERFVLNAANLTYKEIFEKIAKILGVKAPTKPISHKALRFMARVDGFLSFLRLKKRTLTLVLADAGGEVKQYNGEKITKTIDFQYTDIDKTIEEVGKDYVKSQGLGGIND
ncbi:MAG: NAD-dependent epimerase/dehydratase family protein, partial [Capnocytophaga leadbetteri]